MADLRLRVVAGIVSAGVALGVAELLAAFFGADLAPMNAIGATVIDHTPDGVREWAISTFGTNDKAVLYICMGLVAVLVAGLAGAIERTTRAAGSAVLAIFGVVAAIVVAARTSAAGALPTIIGVAVGIYALRVLTRRIDAADAATEQAATETRGVTTGFGDKTGKPAPTPASPRAGCTADPARTERAAAKPERRQVLQGLLVVGGLAVVTGVGGRLLGARRHDVSGERAAVELPQPSAPETPIAPGADLRVPGLTPYLTANEDFYRIDTALVVPQVSKDDWSLRIHGLVDREIRLTWADLANRPAVERLVTLACVSNPVGGDLIGNARWLGYRLDELLAEAGPHPDADMVLSHSTDGWTAGTPLSVLTDGRDALLAVGMNGEPLPVVHGYPARLVVPGLYGYVSATKWVTELEITRFDRATAYWTRRGWSALGPIKTGTRIDTPRPRGRIKQGRTTVAGVAWAQHRGIRAVEVQIDNGPWQTARLADEQSIDTWRQWVYDWDATPGPHTLRARSTDATGEVQTAERRDVVPDGATGHPSVTVQVS
ncbi:molybdopterin-dependent oxidoreductase [Nocardia iowensis]|uniref:Molybdopterin-dependent oxidoreductase n=1 Tax=Nocardia iowensis TaxID=204891 RepID=A0ABX8RPY0_NOCIO|nr:molybdopterin-dependent oxidoreductase [Nocardia iowensis]QXN90480.1 molybdopterin-dependent oxidoreductase [Nocardia iowensis]